MTREPPPPPTKPCPVPSCPNQSRHNNFMCSKHWHHVTPETRREVWRTYRARQEATTGTLDRRRQAHTRAITLACSEAAPP